MSRRRGLVAAVGAAAVGAAAVAAEQVLIRRPRKRAAAAVQRLPDLAGRRTTVTVDDGSSLEVVQNGAGRPVVLVHGLNLSAAIWRHQLETLADAFRVVAYDQRGHGRSAAPSDGADLPRLAADLAHLLDDLDLTDAVLVGHSLGGMVALQLADDHGPLFEKRIGALLLLSTSAGPLTPLPPPAWNETVRRLEPAARRALEAAAARSRPLLATGDIGYLAARIGFGARPRALDVELTRGINFRTSPIVLAGLWDSMLTVDLRHACRALRLPTTIAVGSRDLMTPPRMARAMARSLPAAELVVLPGAGHMPMLERPAEVDGLIRRLAARAG